MQVCACVLYIATSHTLTTAPSTCSQNGVVSAADINATYKALASSTEEFLRELNDRQEEQRIEEEKAEKMRKIKAEQVRVVYQSLILCSVFD